MAFAGIFQPFARLRWIRFGLLMRERKFSRRFSVPQPTALAICLLPVLLLLLVNINSNNLAAMKTVIVCAFALFPLAVVAAVTEVAGLAGLPNQPFLYVASGRCGRPTSLPRRASILDRGYTFP